MQNSGRKWIWLTVGLAICVMMTVFVFRDTVMLYLMPTAVVRNTAVSAFSQLHQQLEEDPMMQAIQYLDPEGKQTADIQLHTADPFLGDIRYDMVLQTAPQKLSGNGIVQIGENYLDMSLYLDDRYMALSSEKLLDGGWYGITYETFEQDLRSVPLLTWMFGETVLQRWNGSIQELQTGIQKERNHMQILAFLMAEAQKILTAWENMPIDDVQVSKDGVEGYKIVYTSEEPSIQNAAFHISEENLTAAEFQYQEGSMGIRIQVTFGKAIPEEPVEFTVSCINGENSYEISAELYVNESSNICYGNWTVSFNEKMASLHYEWDSRTGDMELTQGQAVMQLNLKETGNGLQIQSDDWGQLLTWGTGEETTQNRRIYTGSAVIRKGASITAPEYKNLDQWSLDDFLVMLEALSAVAGIRIGR